jgi:hypothetical protein
VSPFTSGCFESAAEHFFNGHCGRRPDSEWMMNLMPGWADLYVTGADFRGLGD